MTVEYQGEIVIAPRVLEVITGIAAAESGWGTFPPEQKSSG